MTQPPLEELEQKLQVMEGGAEIFETIKSLAAKVTELELEVCQQAEGVQVIVEALKGLIQIDAQRQAEIDALTKRPRPKLDEPPAGGKVN